MKYTVYGHVEHWVRYEVEARSPREAEKVFRELAKAEHPGADEVQVGGVEEEPRPEAVRRRVLGALATVARAKGDKA